MKSRDAIKAKIKLRYAIREMGGMLCELNLKRSHDQEIIIKKQRPIRRSSGKSSEAQKTHRQHFKLTVAYAKAVLADPEVHAQYKAIAQQQGKRPWGAAVSDYLAGIDLLSKK